MTRNSRRFYDGKKILRVLFVSPAPSQDVDGPNSMDAAHGVGTERTNAQNNEESKSSEDCEDNTEYGNVIRIKPDSASWPFTCCGITDNESPGTVIFTPAVDQLVT
jgi:hypothetical protein